MSINFTKSIDNKVVFLGDSSVGKSSIVQRICLNRFNNYQDPTIGAAFLSFSVINNDIRYVYKIWDTAGQERYRTLANMYYRNSDYAVIVFDISQVNSFETVKLWIEEINNNAPKCKIIIVANKIDLPIKENQRKIVNFINEYEYEYFEVSAKTGENINNLFDFIKENNVNKSPEISNKILLNLENKREKKCCY